MKYNKNKKIRYSRRYKVKLQILEKIRNTRFRLLVISHKIRAIILPKSDDKK